MIKNMKCQELKMLDEAAGTFRAAFATLNVKDLGNDVILPGAIEQNTPVRISAYNHSSWGGNLPVGKGKILEQPDLLVLEGEFFLDTTNGNDTYKTVKHLGDLQEWSFGFDVIDEGRGELNGEKVNYLKKLSVYEVAPVLLGEGIGTRTLDIKSLKNAIAPHTTPTVDQSWSASDNLKRLKVDEKAGYYKKEFAYQIADTDGTKKSDYKFPHHEVDGEGNIGAANTRACSAGIAALNGARGGASIPDGDRKGVWNHLARHLKDADMEPPELKAAGEKPTGMKFVDHIDFVLEGIRDLVSRSQAIEELREAEGKTISTLSIDRLKSVRTEMAKITTSLDGIVKSRDAALLLYSDYLAIQQKIRQKQGANYGN